MITQQDMTAMSQDFQESGVGKQLGVKYDKDKPRMDLLDSRWLEDVAAVLSFGANKYAAHNWRGGINVSRLIASAYRHLGAINRGENLDPESNRPHVDHLGCCVQFLSVMLRERPDMDDRYKPIKSAMKTEHIDQYLKTWGSK